MTGGQFCFPSQPSFLCSVKVKVKLSHYRPSGLQEVETPRISRTLAHEAGKVVVPRHRTPLAPWYSFLLEAESTPGKMTLSRIKTSTFQIVALCLNQLRHRVSFSGRHIWILLVVFIEYRYALCTLFIEYRYVLCTLFMEYRYALCTLFHTERYAVYIRCV